MVLNNLSVEMKKIWFVVISLILALILVALTSVTGAYGGAGLPFGYGWPLAYYIVTSVSVPSVYVQPSFQPFFSVPYLAIDYLFWFVVALIIIFALSKIKRR
jgi:ABC-type cobalt transport system substrate-binding protein